MAYKTKFNKKKVETEDEMLARILKLSEDTFSYDEENRRFTEQILASEKMRIDREIVEQQNREYEESIALDRQKKSKTIVKPLTEEKLPYDIPKIREGQITSEHREFLHRQNREEHIDISKIKMVANVKPPTEEKLPDDIPKTREELREARMRYFKIKS